jgi:Ca2+-transporting ATPase
MNADRIKGLAPNYVVKRQKDFGFNELPNQNRRSAIKTIVGLITEPMIFLLFVTVIIYFILGDRNEALLLLISFVGIIGIELYQEAKTDKSLRALKDLSSPVALVIRNGQE